MTIEINRPDLEALIQDRLHSGVFATIDEVLANALELQRDHEDWLQDAKTDIGEKIAQGLDQLDRGEGIPGDQVRDRLAARKAAFLADQVE